MFPIINIHDINLSAPYFVYASHDNESIKFTTDNVLLFICDAQDDRQYGRNLLFSKWYHIHGSKIYHKEDLIINVDGTCSYYASFICRKDHPSLKIMQETFIDFQKKNSK